MVGEKKVLDLDILLLPGVKFSVEEDDLVGEFGELGECVESVEFEFEEVELGVHELRFVGELDGHVMVFIFHLFLLQHVVVLVGFGLTFLLHCR